jgi:hypothetical protein
LGDILVLNNKLSLLFDRSGQCRYVTGTKTPRSFSLHHFHEKRFFVEQWEREDLQKKPV